MVPHLLAAAALGAALARGLAEPRDLGDLTLEQLSNVVVETVSGRNEPLARALGSVYVITADDIRRSGYTSLPEILRLAPNLQIARTGAGGWAISARGFNDTLSNKLLVLVDGRSLYTPTFAGVFWDAQDLVLEDIERIEVISGPGGVLWGANAVNGVINVTTKSSADTERFLVAAGGGNAEARVTGRYGGALPSGHWRAYLQGAHQEDTELPDGTDNLDEVDRLQAGFRTDWERGESAFTVQGDVYASEGDEDPDPQELRGTNLLARWTRKLGGDDLLRAQAYYDYTSRQQQHLDTVDLELEHVLSPRGAHSFLWGGGIRRMHDRIDNSAAFAFLPPDKKLTSWNLYVQDDIALNEDWSLSAGVKADRNSYTGVEWLPSVRTGWSPGTGNLAWAAVSRAVRVPSRLDRELFIPGAPPFLLVGGPDFRSEVSWVYEIGYRGQPAPRFSWAATGFYHDHERQRSVAPGVDGATIENDVIGRTAGIEAWGAFRLTERWRVSGGYTYLDKELHVRPGEVDLQQDVGRGSDPKQWAKLRSALDIGESVELDVMLRFYDRLENRSVPAYLAVDGRLGWAVSPRVELSALVRNLTDDAHIEWAPGQELERTFYLKALVRF